MLLAPKMGVSVLVLRCVFGKVWLHFCQFRGFYNSFWCVNRLVFVSARRTQSTHKTVIEGLGYRKKVHLVEDYKVGPLLFLRESQRQQPVTTNEAQNRKAKAIVL